MPYSPMVMSIADGLLHRIPVTPVTPVGVLLLMSVPGELAPRPSARLGGTRLVESRPSDYPVAPIVAGLSNAAKRIRA